MVPSKRPQTSGCLRGTLTFAVCCRWQVLSMLVAIGVCGSAPALAQDAVFAELAQSQEQLVNVIARAEPSVVAITRLTIIPEQPFPLDFDPFESLVNPASEEEFLPGEFGSGVVIAEEDGGHTKLILTNHHVVTSGIGKNSAGSRFWIRTSTKHTLAAQIHAYDPRSDLAILKVDLSEQRAGLKPEDLPLLHYGAGNTVRKGMLVLALGNPLAIARDGSCSVTFGMISNIGRRSIPDLDKASRSDEQLIHHFGTLLHVDTRLPLGMSGGALINLQGELIGLTTSLESLQGYDRSAGFAIPLDESTRRIIDSLVRGVEVEYGFLGITPDKALADDLLLTRPRVTQPTAARAGRVAHGSPAEQGKLQTGDLILAVNNRTVYDGEDLIREVGLLGPGEVAELRVFRQRTKDFGIARVKLGKWPVHDDTRIVTSAARYEPWRGMQVDYSTARRRYMTSAFLTEYVRAVVITEVTTASPAAASGLEPGLFVTAVDGVVVETPSEFHQALPATDREVEFTLTDGRRIIVGVDDQ